MREKTVEQYIEEMKLLSKKSTNIEDKNKINIPPKAVEVIAETIPEVLPKDGMGSLIVVVNSAESRPLQGATVVISEPETQREIYRLVTDESGKTAPVNLSAPLKDTTLSPNSGEIVYGLYDITASADNFVTSTVRNIPIFDSVVSIQQMRLLWLSAAGDQTNQQTENEGNPYTL